MRYTDVIFVDCNRFNIGCPWNNNGRPGSKSIDQKLNPRRTAKLATCNNAP